MTDSRPQKATDCVQLAFDPLDKNGTSGGADGSVIFSFVPYSIVAPEGKPSSPGVGTIATRNTASDFTVSEPPQCIPGDVNGDGSTDISDAMLVFYHVARKKLLPNEKLFAANVDKNKEVDIADAMQIFYFVAKKITELPT